MLVMKVRKTPVHTYATVASTSSWTHDNEDQSITETSWGVSASRFSCEALRDFGVSIA